MTCLFVYNTETKETKPLFPIGEVSSSNGIWSPDGKKIGCNLHASVLWAFYTFDFIEKNIGIEPVLSKVDQYIPRDFGTELAKIDLSLVDKTDLELYTGLDFLKKRQMYPIWSPDGKWIAVSGFISNSISKWNKCECYMDYPFRGRNSNQGV